VVRPDGSWQNLAIVPAIVINLRETPEQSTKADRSRAQATAKKTAPGVSYGEIGIGLSCGGCSTTYYRANGRTLYEFTSPIEVVGLAPDGPAEKSGIRKGDRITAVDGNPIGSKKGSKAFSNLQAGKATKLTILRNGSILTLTVVPAPKETK
jgi:membrane-associated protease RseP (regulator of RpoE activity)